jgi:GAF domain-containing protein
MMGGVLLAEVAAVVNAGRPRRARAGAAAELIRTATGARWVGIYSVVDGFVRNEGWSGPGAPAHPQFSVTDGLTSHAISGRSIAVSNDVTRDPRYLTNQSDTGSELIVPVLHAGDVIGTLDVESNQPAAFTGPAIAQYEALAEALRALWQRTDRD